jgi:hypothetical protein
VRVATGEGPAANSLKIQLKVLGTPGVEAVRRALLTAMLSPINGKPGRPHDIFVTHR